MGKIVLVAGEMDSAFNQLILLAQNENFHNFNVPCIQIKEHLE